MWGAWVRQMAWGISHRYCTDKLQVMGGCEMIRTARLYTNRLQRVTWGCHRNMTELRLFICHISCVLQLSHRRWCWPGWLLRERDGILGACECLLWGALFFFFSLYSFCCAVLFSLCRTMARVRVDLEINVFSKLHCPRYFLMVTSGFLLLERGALLKCYGASLFSGP